MSQKSVVPFKVYKPLSLQGNGTYNAEVLTGTKTLTKADAQFQILDPAGQSVEVVLPAAADCEGMFFFIYNRPDLETADGYAAGDSLEVMDSDGSTRLLGLNAEEQSTFLSNGDAWISLGIVLAAIE